MTAEIWTLYGAIVLGLVHISADSFSFKAQAGNAYTVGPRDTVLAREKLAGRLHRAARNYTENFALFAATVFMLQMSEISGPLSKWGAYCWLGARIVYIFAYASSIPWFRTICWQVASVGLVMMLLQVVIR